MTHNQFDDYEDLNVPIKRFLNKLEFFQEKEECFVDMAKKFDLFKIVPSTIQQKM